MTKQADTIAIKGGTQYAKVATRLAEFHKDNPHCRIVTSMQVTEGGSVVFTATITTKKGEFTGHSAGRINGDKAFEKLETIAVGRALAFAGYLASGEIACAEEMADVVSQVQLDTVRNKYFFAHKDGMKGLSRSEQQDAFVQWCYVHIGERSDFGDVTQWRPEWIRICLAALDEVPFG